ncbi:hypothetical protein ZL58_23495 [Salmonella enterica subsp. enterica serovar Typhimurium]|nr:hypothetical protein [Salmonella enterica subsp. enterica serovar Typhimurium]
MMQIEKYINYDEENEERSERRRLNIMAFILILLFPVLFGGMYFIDKLIQNSRPVLSPVFSSISECVEYGNNIDECTKAWSNTLPSFYRLYKHSPAMLISKDNHQVVDKFCNIELFIKKMLSVDAGSVENLRNAGTSIMITPYRDIGKVDNDIKLKIAELWLETGLKLYQSNQNVEAIQAWEFIIETFGESNHTYLQIKVAEAWFNIGMLYYELNKHEKSIFYWKKIGEQYSNSSNPAIMAIVGKAAVNMGQVSMLLNKNIVFRTINNQ